MSPTPTCCLNMLPSPTCCPWIHRCRRRRHVASTCSLRRHVALGNIDVADADMLPQHVALADMLPSDTSMSPMTTCCLTKLLVDGPLKGRRPLDTCIGYMSRSD